MRLVINVLKALSSLHKTCFGSRGSRQLLLVVAGRFVFDAEGKYRAPDLFGDLQDMLGRPRGPPEGLIGKVNDNLWIRS